MVASWISVNIIYFVGTGENSMEAPEYGEQIWKSGSEYRKVTIAEKGLVKWKCWSYSRKLMGDNCL